VCRSADTGDEPFLECIPQLVVEFVEPLRKRPAGTIEVPLPLDQPLFERSIEINLAAVSVGPCDAVDPLKGGCRLKCLIVVREGLIQPFDGYVRMSGSRSGPDVCFWR
jgi:hypothetical protein